MGFIKTWQIFELAIVKTSELVDPTANLGYDHAHLSDALQDNISTLILVFSHEL